MLFGPINSGAAVGADGVATATGTSALPVRGMLYQVQVKYNDSPPVGTTDITIKTKGSNPPSFTILDIANAATDGVFQPRFDECKASDGSALSTNNGMIALEDYVQVVIAGANAADNVDVWLYCN
jgi:hypothetical protein